MNILIGHTGFIVNHLIQKMEFNQLFNTQNINTFNNTALNHQNLYLSCLPAKKYLVNQNPQSDIQNINNIINQIKHKSYEKIILISTIDVYCNAPIHSTENFYPEFLIPNYGSNRYFFEILVKKYLNYQKLTIIRLPALFGKNIKKNILFDLLNNNQIDKINYNSGYQWYDIENLTTDIDKCSNSQETIHNLFPEPIETKELCKTLFNIEPNINTERITYDFKTKHHPSGYIMSKEECLNKLKKFKNEYSNK